MTLPILLIASVLQAPADSTLVVRAGRLLDPLTGQSLTNVVLVMRDGRIAERIENGRYQPPPNTRVLDLSALTVLPGLIDTHVHLTIAGRPRDNAASTARAGFTTVADLGSAAYAAQRLKKLIEADSVAGPRILAAGSWIGGRAGVCEFGGATIRGAQEASARLAADLAAGAQLIKLCVTNWLDPAVQSPDSVELTEAELSEIAAAAARARVPLVAHAIGQRGALRAIAHGVRWLAHTPVVDSAGAVAIATSRACVSTTMTSLSQGASATSLRASFQRMQRSGVRFVLGTDAGVLPHGSNANELVTLQNLGMTPVQALRAATTTAAECLGLPSDYASLKVGAPANLIAVAGDPLTDLKTLLAPAAVVMRGRVLVGQ
jgi:imidazolonepropionase-like amidohydrolase